MASAPPVRETTPGTNVAFRNPSQKASVSGQVLVLSMNARMPVMMTRESHADTAYVSATPDRPRSPRRSQR